MWTFGRRIAVGFGFAFLLMVIIGVVAYYNIVALADTSRAVARRHSVVERLAEVLTTLTDAAAGQRGFGIPGDEAFLDPYRSGSTSVVRAMKSLQTILADDPAQRQQLEEAEPVVARKLADMAR